MQHEHVISQLLHKIKSNDGTWHVMYYNQPRVTLLSKALALALTSVMFSLAYMLDCASGLCTEEFTAGVGGMAVPLEKVSPRTFIPRHDCPPGHCCLGMNVPLYEILSPPCRTLFPRHSCPPPPPPPPPAPLHVFTFAIKVQPNT